MVNLRRRRLSTAKTASHVDSGSDNSRPDRRPPEWWDDPINPFLPSPADDGLAWYFRYTSLLCLFGFWISFWDDRDGKIKQFPRNKFISFNFQLIKKLSIPILTPTRRKYRSQFHEHLFTILETNFSPCLARSRQLIWRSLMIFQTTSKCTRHDQLRSVRYPLLWSSSFEVPCCCWCCDIRSISFGLEFLPFPQ